jgi:hypothetical protein
VTPGPLQAHVNQVFGLDSKNPVPISVRHPIVLPQHSIRAAYADLSSHWEYSAAQGHSGDQTLAVSLAGYGLSAALSITQGSGGFRWLGWLWQLTGAMAAEVALERVLRYIAFWKMDRTEETL